MTDEEWTETRYRGHLNRMRATLADHAERAMYAVSQYEIPADLPPHHEMIDDLESIRDMATEMLEKLDG